MSSDSFGEELISDAVAGDRIALEQILLAHHDRLAAYIRRQFPPALQGIAEVEDILHKTYVKVFAGIASCEGRTKRAFYGWLRTIARNQLADDLKHRMYERRVGRGHRFRGRADSDSWVLDLSERLAGRNETPSREAARHEAVRAMQVALAALREDYRQAIWLRYMQGLSIERTAKVMDRTPDSVRGLCARARRKLRDILGRASSYSVG